MTTSKFEEILNSVETGPWNWLIFLLCSLWGIFGAMQAVASAFLSPPTDHWCYIPQLTHWTKQHLWNFSMPRATVGGIEQHSQCEMYDFNYTALQNIAWENLTSYHPYINATTTTTATTATTTANLTTIPCTSWEYDTSVFTSTLISEWDLVCGRESLRSLIQSIFMVGYFFGAPLGGYCSDRFGRKRLMSGSLWCFIVVSAVGSVSPYYPLFLLCRFAMALSGTVVYQASYILAVEASSVRHRSVVGILFSVPFALGFMLLPGLAYCIREWRYLHLAISVPVILLIVNTIVLPESPRWLLQKGKWSEATEVLHRAARWNSSKTFDSAWLVAAITQLKIEAEEEEEGEDKENDEGEQQQHHNSSSSSNNKREARPEDETGQLFLQHHHHKSSKQTPTHSRHRYCPTHCLSRDRNENPEDANPPQDQATTTTTTTTPPPSKQTTTTTRHFKYCPTCCISRDRNENADHGPTSPLSQQQHQHHHHKSNNNKNKNNSSSSSPCFAVSYWRQTMQQSFVFLRTPMMRRISLILYLLWLICSMVYYGISLNSANFSVDPFLYMFLGGLMEIPSYTLTIPMVARLGRKIVLIGFLVLCGVSILVLLLMRQDRDKWYFLTLVMFGKFSITSAYQVIYLYSSELYPTCVRTRGIGVASMMGRVGAILSPFVNDILGLYHWAVPSTIFGLLSISAALLTCLLPETNNRPLPDTVEEVENWTRGEQLQEEIQTLNERAVRDREEREVEEIEREMDEIEKEIEDTEREVEETEKVIEREGETEREGDETTVFFQPSNTNTITTTT